MVSWVCLQFVIVVFSDHTYFFRIKILDTSFKMTKRRCRFFFCVCVFFFFFFFLGGGGKR